ncbi:MAG: hypothetical protein ACREJM_09305 [Candidatus Saccharimonadales bacterium]
MSDDARQNDEVEPYVAYRLEGDKMDFALRPLADGDKALALFLSAEAARDFLDETGSPLAWRIVQPVKRDLLKILEECWEAGILRAVLDTNQPDRPMLFEIFDVLQAERASGGQDLD